MLAGLGSSRMPLTASAAGPAHGARAALSGWRSGSRPSSSYWSWGWLSPSPGSTRPRNNEGKTRMVFPHRRALRAQLLPFRYIDGLNLEGVPRDVWEANRDKAAAGVKPAALATLVLPKRVSEWSLRPDSFANNWLQALLLTHMAQRPSGAPTAEPVGRGLRPHPRLIADR